MLQPSVNSWLYSSRYHCPFWFPLVFFPWDQGDLFLVQGLVKWGVTIVTDSWYKPSPSAIPPAGISTLPKVGQQPGVARHCSPQGGIDNCSGLSRSHLMYMKRLEGNVGGFCRKHTSCCLCWPNKWVSVRLGLCSGLLLLVCWYKSAVRAALAASTWEVTQFLKIY